MRSKTRRVDEQALAFVSTAKIDRTLLPERKKEEKNDGASSKTFLWNEHSGTGPCGAALAQHGGATPPLFGRTSCKNCRGKRGYLVFFKLLPLFFSVSNSLRPSWLRHYIFTYPIVIVDHDQWLTTVRNGCRKLSWSLM